jgi:hypothetical protein
LVVPALARMMPPDWFVKVSGLMRSVPDAVFRISP